MTTTIDTSMTPSSATGLEAAGVKVKLLEWDGDHAAAMFNIEYQIVDNGNGSGFIVWMNGDEDSWQSDCGLLPTKDAAKAAAQADYTARILSALEPSGEGVGAEPVGEVGSMPGTTGFTMATFRAEDAPIGTKLYAQPLSGMEGVARRGIYIASKVKHAARWRNLRAEGAPIISTWIDEAGEGESQDLADLWRRCLSEASSAAAIIVYREPDEVLKGAWVELGAAASHGVPVFAIGIRDFTIANHESIHHVETIGEAMTAIRALAPVSAASPEGEAEALAWFAKNICLELSWGPVSDDEGDQCQWCVHERRGNVNDQEWELVGHGDTPIAAINDARHAASPSTQEKNHG